jgi:hypothetical protein
MNSLFVKMCPKNYNARNHTLALHKTFPPSPNLTLFYLCRRAWHKKIVGHSFSRPFHLVMALANGKCERNFWGRKANRRGHHGHCVGLCLALSVATVLSCLFSIGWLQNPVLQCVICVQFSITSIIGLWMDCIICVSIIWCRRWFPIGLWSWFVYIMVHTCTYFCWLGSKM